MDVLDEALKKSERWMKATQQLTDGLQFNTTPRNRVAVSLYHLSMEHQHGIHTLVKYGVISSAFALLRPQIEAYVRGCWFARCASDKDIERFIRNEELPGISALITDLEKHEAFSGGSLRRIKKDLWDTLCGFTHGGSIQVKARVTEDEIKQSYKIEHIVSLTNAAPTVSCVAVLGMVAIVDDQARAVKVYEAWQEIYGTVPPAPPSTPRN